MGQKTQRQIASEVGYDQPNIISMWKRGETKVPLRKIPALARSIGGDPTHMWRLALEQFDEPGVGQAVQEIFGNIVSNNEAELVFHVRQLTNDADVSFSASVMEAIKVAILGVGDPEAADPETPAPEEEPGGLQDLNFKVDPAFHRRFKTEAAQLGISMKQLLEECFASRIKEGGG